MAILQRGILNSEEYFLQINCNLYVNTRSEYPMDQVSLFFCSLMDIIWYYYINRAKASIKNRLFCNVFSFHLSNI